MSQDGGVALRVGVGCSSQDLVPHQKSRGPHPGFDRCEVVSEIDFAGLSNAASWGEQREGLRCPPVQPALRGSCTFASALPCLL